MLQIGPYKLSAIETGEFALDGGAMFGVVPKPLWETKINVDSKNRIDMRLRALLIQGNGKNILVDTGMGNKWDQKMNDIYRADSSRFSLERSLSEKGLKTGDITDVILTHLHFDHAGGATRLENGKMVPAFPNAAYYVQKRHFEWALKPTERDRGSFRRDDFIPLEEHGVLKKLESPNKLFPGISFYLSFGHTEAQQHVVISDHKTTLFYCADLMPTSLHVSLPWIMAYDLRPLETLKEKKEILKEASEKNWVLFFEHCPLLAAAFVTNDGERYKILKEADVS